MTKPIFPGPPPPKKKGKTENKPIFGDIEKRQTGKKFCQDLRGALFGLRNNLLARKAMLADLIVQFTSRINGPGDITTLPYISKDGKTKNNKIDDCVAAIISQAIIQGWRFQICEIGKEEAYKAIERIKKITKVGLHKCRVGGDPKGYYLVIPKD